jgi:hypothetical protein
MNEEKPKNEQVASNTLMNNRKNNVRKEKVCYLVTHSL